MPIRFIIVFCLAQDEAFFDEYSPLLMDRRFRLIWRGNCGIMRFRVDALHLFFRNQHAYVPFERLPTIR
jgi:hypothetical protein